MARLAALARAAAAACVAIATRRRRRCRLNLWLSAPCGRRLYARLGREVLRPVLGLGPRVEGGLPRRRKRLGRRRAVGCDQGAGDTDETEN
eukprot:6183653-Pleurochrysis_carterae.AAC.1